MEEAIKILIVPSLDFDWEAEKLGEKLADMGYKIEMTEGAFGEICGLEYLARSNYQSCKPDVVLAIGIGCITVGKFVESTRIMINPNFHYSDFLKKWVDEHEERIKSGLCNESWVLQTKQDCKDAKYDAQVAERLESMDYSLRGKKPMLGIFTHESDNMADYEDRYGVYEVDLSLTLSKSESLDIIAKRIDLFLK